MFDSNITIFVGIYMACGVLWCTWQSGSQFARRNLAQAMENKQAHLNFLGFVIGVFIWPLGPIGYLAFWLAKMSNQKTKKKDQSS